MRAAGAGDDELARDRAVHVVRAAQPLVGESGQVRAAQVQIELVARVRAVLQFDVRRPGCRRTRRPSFAAAADSAAGTPARPTGSATESPHNGPRTFVSCTSFHSSESSANSPALYATASVAAADEPNSAINTAHRRRSLNRRLLTLEIHVPSRQ